MRILLIGGTGFLSGRILERACQAGHSVLYVTRGRRPQDGASAPASAAQHVVADRNVDDLGALLKSQTYDVVIDSICYNSCHARQSVDLAKSCGRLLMVSTDYVYAPRHRRLKQDENNAVFSDFDDYGGHKRRAEVEILRAHEILEVQATIFRPPHIYGPGSNPGTIPLHGRKPHLLVDIAAGKTLRLLQGGLCLIHPIYFDDFARIILKMIEAPASYGQVINCSGPELMTHYEYYEAFANQIDAPLSVEPFFPDSVEIKKIGINPYVGGHRYYDLTKLNGILPSFVYTPFKKGVANWVRSLAATDAPG